jgi:hypothetical protein
VAERARTQRLDATLRVLASLAGTLPVSFLAALCLARFLPLAEDVRFTIGYTLAIPLWATAIHFVFLARSGARAWAVCLGASAVLGALAYGVPQ